MLECGPSVLAAMKGAGLDPSAPDVILISHLHGDHFGGIPFLYLEYMFRTTRKRPLVIAGPATMAERVDELYRALYKDIARCKPLCFEVRFVELEPDVPVELGGACVEPFLVPHSAEPYSLGYRVTAGGGSLLFSGDSAWTDEFIERSRDVDLFLCECCSMTPQSNLHTSYEEILAHRAALGCKQLLLTHLGSDVRAAALGEQRAHDGLVVEIV
jgi:ribonuclease BN (tRNA processing enzyme)